MKKSYTYSIGIAGIVISILGLIWYINYSNRYILTTLNTSSSVYMSLFDPTGSLLATSSEDGSIHLWNTQNWELVQTFQNEEPIISFDFSPNGKDIVGISRDGMVYMWNIDTQKRHTVTASKLMQERIVSIDQGKLSSLGYLSHVRFDKTGNRVAISSKNGHIFLLDVQDGIVLYQVQGHLHFDYHELIRDTEFILGGTELISVGNDETAHVWKLDEETNLLFLPNQQQILLL